MQNSKLRTVRMALAGSAAVGLLILAAPTQGQQRQQRRAEPTRAEILRGTLTPIRTCYDVTDYNLDVRVDPSDKSIKGSNKITFKTVDDFEKMQIDLFSNMNVERIVFDGNAPATFERELNAIFVQLPEKVKKGSSHSITVYYGG